MFIIPLQTWSFKIFLLFGMEVCVCDVLQYHHYWNKIDFSGRFAGTEF